MTSAAFKAVVSCASGTGRFDSDALPPYQSEPCRNTERSGKVSATFSENTCDSSPTNPAPLERSGKETGQSCISPVHAFRAVIVHQKPGQGGPGRPDLWHLIDAYNATNDPVARAVIVDAAAEQ